MSGALNRRAYGVLRNPVVDPLNYFSSGVTTASITFNSDGTVTANPTSSSWYNPVTAGIGAQYWIRINGGGWFPLSSAVATSYTNSAGGTVDRSVEIATDSAGLNIVATGTLTLLTSGTV
jgi:hypothetical protein